MEDTNSEVVLRVTSAASPGYLRAMAFITYRPSEWKEGSNRSHVAPDERRLFGRMSLFHLSNRQANREMTVRHESTVIDALFTPLGACSIEAPFDDLDRDDDDGTLKARDTRANLTYHIDYSTSLNMDPPSPDMIRRMTNLQYVDARFRPLANRIFRNCRTTAEKIEAVTEYFHTNYTYSLGLSVPADQDLSPTSSCRLPPLLRVFRHRCGSPAASGGRADPYVTGFFVSDRDEDGKSWVARNMDAHAWVEAWDAERNTWGSSRPVPGRPGQQLPGRFVAGESEGRSVLLTRFIQAVYDYGLLHRRLVLQGLQSANGDRHVDRILRRGGGADALAASQAVPPPGDSARRRDCGTPGLAQDVGGHGPQGQGDRRPATAAGDVARLRRAGSSGVRGHRRPCSGPSGRLVSRLCRPAILQLNQSTTRRGAWGSGPESAEGPLAWASAPARRSCA